MNPKGKYLFTCALSKSEYDKIISYDSANEIWDRLQTLHKGTNQVKEKKRLACLCINMKCLKC